ncbi:MAG TPA: tripartite tricarboxylate transporter substrate-binding protein [Candidatus Acidoferrales bacterium]|nr:tripartite tricarboxylate transporter substrate-binding protein [Candidatus Acidoferrales bacterium]
MNGSITRSKTAGVGFGLALIVGLLAQAPLNAAEQPFYAGKTVTIVAGFAPGGTIDLRARLFARHLAKYIPGSPAIVVQNQVGAGGLVAANYVFSVAKPDGLTLLHFPSSTVMNSFLTETGNVRYDIRQVPIIWLGSDSWLTVANPSTTGVKKAGDLFKTAVQLRVGGSGVSSLRSLRPKIALELFGVEHAWVNGYKGSADLLLAFEKGEIHLFEDPQDGYQANIQPREKAGAAAVLWQTGIIQPDESFTRSRLLPHVPTLDEALPREKKQGMRWQAWKAAVIPQAFQYSVGLHPGTPPDRIQILTQAFAKMTQDAAFRADFEKALGEPPDAVIGEQADRIVKDGLKKLFEDYKAGVEYLRALAQGK